jgi:hypothetical protein
MEKRSVGLPWEQDGWLEEATGWIHSQLAGNGLEAIGPLELLHQRAWSTFARLATDHGIVYFKAPAPAFAFEAGLTQYLAGRRPDCSVPLLGINRERGWLLSLDAGVTLRAADPGVGQISHWLKVLPLYVELQVEMASRVPELLELGIPDRRLSQFPRQFDELLEAGDSLRVGLEPGLSADEFLRLRALRPRVVEWCQELAAYGLPETLTHEEVHDANVLVNGERYIFTDWSDSSLAHPFFSLLVTLRAAAYRLELPEDGPEILRLREAYLEPWTKSVPKKLLVSAFDLAYHLGMANRALSWRRGLESLAWKHVEPYADSVSGWLQDFLNYPGEGG